MGDRSAGVPRDAVHIANILREQGADSWEPRVVPQLLEFLHRHVADTLGEAKFFAEYRKTRSADHKLPDAPDNKRGADITIQDLKSAQDAVARRFTNNIPRSQLDEMAGKVNKRDLPEVKARPGLLVPSEGALTAANFQIHFANEEVDLRVPRGASAAGAVDHPVFNSPAPLGSGAALPSGSGGALKAGAQGAGAGAGEDGGAGKILTSFAMSASAQVGDRRRAEIGAMAAEEQTDAMVD